MADVRRMVAVAVPTAPRVISTPPTGSCHEAVSFVPASTAAGIGPGVRLGVVCGAVRCCAPVGAAWVVCGRELGTGGVVFCVVVPCVVVRWVVVGWVVVFVLVDVSVFVLVDVWVDG